MNGFVIQLLIFTGDTHVPFSKLGRSFKLPQTATLALRAPEQCVYILYPLYWTFNNCPLSLITKNTISVRGRVPMVPFLRRARRPPRAPQSNHRDQLHHQGARPPRERLRVVRFADPSLRFRPGRERRGRVRAQLVAAKSPATAGTKI
jgi:hypothetical protein